MPRLTRRIRSERRKVNAHSSSVKMGRWTSTISKCVSLLSVQGVLSTRSLAILTSLTQTNSVVLYS